ncbi:homoserine dehydrogenase [Desulfonispora thiosulfatigenes DSM 11270]|uniref:Homoserine dehydrogenase n=1 Tax=Desulfonispora thiosulfatigenes DSM 11270 TaxID=656914 RepID=A0A1W1VMD9_DESTI|nr:homoserine dehydrogenase [Desulfonispora thiosulfatigenes]SMB94486.1 homoserine dehydrogenase [Desulfonispora thiosulfatigenes DSM 11270]
MSKIIKVGLLGLGTVGTGVYKLLEKQKEKLLLKSGTNIEIKKILVKNKDKERPVDKSMLTDDWQEIINDPEIQIIVELMGGMEPAKGYIVEALQKGKHVVTANKDLMAEYGQEFFAEAESQNVDLAFEASVGGGIPIIRPLKQCLVGNDLTEIFGIINGTTNFILTKMTNEDVEFGDVLKEAQELGYAEADPTADVEGYDAARKLAILSSLAFHSRVTFKDVFVEGITKISSKDIEYAKELGYVIKLIAIGKNTEDGIEVRVHPTLIPNNQPLAAVNDSFNAVFVKGDAIGEAMFYGPGAGELPTASAVVGDIIDVARNIVNNCTNRINCTCYDKISIMPKDEIKTRYYIRLQVQDESGVFASISSVLGNQKVSLASVIQKQINEKNEAEIVIITHVVKEKQLMEALKLISELPIVSEVSSVIRVEDI